MKHRFVIILLILIQSTLAQDIKFTATAPKVVEAGEIFRLSFTVNARGESFIGPLLNNFEYSGPSTSSNFSTQIINGKTKQTASYSYNYTLRAKKEGKFTIGPSKITVDGKQYQTKPVTIDVVKGRAQTTNPNQQADIDNNQISDKDLYTKILISNTNVFKGQHILATIKIYTRLNLGGLGDHTFPSYNGFWSQELPVAQQVTLQRENINGEIFNVGVIKKTLLFPQRTGEIIIDPFEITCAIRKQSKSRSIFDDFFGSVQTTNKRIASPLVKINVKDLPDGQPASYEGAVGQFSLKSSIDRNEVKANEAITLKVILSGNGNLKLIDPLEFEFPPDFEIFEPKVQDNYQATETGLRGIKTFEYLVIPRHAGEFNIPPVEFSYFDPVSNSYKSRKTASYELKVLKGDTGAGDVIISGFSKEDIKYIGSDIRYIRTGEIKLKKQGNIIFGSFKFYLAYIIPLIITLIVLFYRKRVMSKRSDTQLQKNRLASKVSRKRLKKASAFLKDEKREEFCNEILKALWGYLGDKLGIPTSDISRDIVKDELNRREVDEEAINSFTEVIDSCEYDRYAPAGESVHSEIIYKKAAETISRLEQQIK